MARQIKRTKTSKKSALPLPPSSYHKTGMDCIGCGEWVENIGHGVRSVTCGNCVMRMVAPPEIPKHLQKQNEEQRPRGWQFRKEYISPSGKKFHFGREVDESTTSDPTSVSGATRKGGRKPKLVPAAPSKPAKRGPKAKPPAKPSKPAKRPATRASKATSAPASTAKRAKRGTGRK